MSKQTVLLLFAALTPLGCSSDSSSTPAADTGSGLDATVESSCSTAGSSQTHAGWIYTDETWTADQVHVITADFTVAQGVTLTVAPCAEIRLQQGKFFYVKGQLVARGQADQRIRFHRDDEAERFASISIGAPGFADLAYVDIEGGGDLASQSFGATVVVEGSDFPPTQPLRVEHVLIKHSAGHGLYLTKWAAFASGSTDLTVQTSGEEGDEHPFPIRMSLNAVKSVPEGKYLGNKRDEIQLIGESPHYNVEIDDQIHDRGVPYQIGGGGEFGIIGVRGTAGPTLTIDPGVTLKFYSSSSNVGGFFIGGTGSGISGQVIAAGTATKPILLTGAGDNPGPGYWEGVSFEGALTSGNRLEYVQINAAGAHGGDTGVGCPPPSTTGTDGAVKIFSEPASEFITNSTISNSSTHGIFRAWSGAELSFLPSNTFSGVAGCNEVLPKTATGDCRTDPPCPQ
jgi:hypothetical protein